MKFVKQSFMGMELDILTGHPEHDILFIATQVAREAGLSNPSHRAHLQALKVGHGLAIQVEYLKELETLKKPKGVQKTSWFFSEAATYQMLLRGHAPQSEPFRKWVTEEVLPSSRKTGKYNAEDSQNPIALAIMDELKSLRGEIVSLRQELQAKTFSLEAPVAAVASPYEGQPGVALCDPAGFNVRLCIVKRCGARSRIDATNPPLGQRKATKRNVKHPEPKDSNYRSFTVPDTFPQPVPELPLKIITRTFGGKPLTILLGHEDSELIFVVNQVAEIGHIASPSAAKAMTMEATEGFGFLQLGDLLALIQNPEQLGAWGLDKTKGDTWLASSGAAYRMLLRLGAPLAELFKKWLIDCLLPEVREIGDAVGATDIYPDEVDQLKSALRLLERRLNASSERERRLERMLHTCDRNLVKATMELIALRRGVPNAANPCNPPPSFLERVQDEFNELSDRWWHTQRRDENELHRAERDERWYREYFTAEKQKTRL